MSAPSFRLWHLAAGLLAMSAPSPATPGSNCSDGLLGLAEQLVVGDAPVFKGTVRRTTTAPACALPVLPAYPAAGTNSRTIAWGQTESVDTSFHGALVVQSGGTLALKPGEYRIASLAMEWGTFLRVDTAGLSMNATRPGLRIVVQGRVNLLDGFASQYPGLSDSLAATRIALIVAGQQTIDVSWGSTPRLQLLAPQSTLTLRDGVAFQGRFLVRKAVIGNGVGARFAADGTSPPAEKDVVAITGPRRFWTNASKVDVHWTVNGLAQTTETSEALPTEGAHEIRRCFGSVCDAVVAMVDRTPPAVAIVAPSDGSITNAPGQTLRWTVDGVPASEAVALQEGANTLTRTGTDSAGNTASASVSVRLDTRAPVVSIASPENGALVNVPATRILWNADGIPREDVENLVEGRNIVVRTARDDAGNAGSASVMVELDTRPPAVEILHPADGAVIPGSTTKLAWSVDGNRDEADVDLAEGANVLVRSATDAAGNIGSDTVRVTSVPERGRISAIAEAPSSAYTLTTPPVIGYRSTAPSGTSLSFGIRQISGAVVSLQGGAEGEWSFLARDAGTVAFEVTVSDASGALDDAKDTVSILIRDPANLWERLQLLETDRSATESEHPVSIAEPSREWSFSVGEANPSIGGTVSLDTLSRRISWARTAEDFGVFDAASDKWTNSDITLPKGDNLIAYTYVDDSGKLSVDRALVTYWDSLLVTRFDVTGRFHSRQAITHQVCVGGRFADGLQSLELVRIAASGETGLGVLVDDGTGVDESAGDGIWSGEFTYAADSAETVFLRVRGTFPTGSYSSQIRSFFSMPEVSAERLEQAFATNDTAGALYGRTLAESGVDAAREAVLSWLAQHPCVKEAGLGPDGYGLSWIHESGANMVVASAPEGTLGRTASLKPFSVNIPANPAQSWGASTAGWSDLSRWQIAPLPADAEYANDLRHWEAWAGNRGTFIASHGGVWGLSAYRAGEPRSIQSGNLMGNFVYSGFSKVDGVNVDKAGFFPESRDAAPRFVGVTSPNGTLRNVGLTVEYFRRTNVADPNGTLLFLAACQSGRRYDSKGRTMRHSMAKDMEETRFGGGGNALVGFTSWVRPSTADVVGRKLLHHLHRGLTLRQAMDSIYVDPDVLALPGTIQIQQGRYLVWKDYDKSHGGEFYYALRAFGNLDFSFFPQVLAAGRNDHGQLGDGTTKGHAAPGAVIGSGNLDSVATSHAASVGLLHDGKLLSWGNNSNDELGNNQTTYGQRETPDSVLYIKSGVVKPLPGIVKVRGANFGHSDENPLVEGRFLALDNAGAVYAWGRNDLGQTGLPSTIRANRAKLISFGLGLKATTIEAGGRHGIALLDDGSVGTFGYGYTIGQGEESRNGQLLPRGQGIGRVVHRNLDGTCPEMDTENRILKNVVAVGAGANISFAVTGDDKVYAWGNNYSGEAGIDTWVAGKYCAWEIGTLSGKRLLSIVGGTNHTLGLDASGDVWSWGSNEYGATGMGVNAGVYPPMRIPGLSGIRKIAAGDNTSAVLGNDGSVWVWGRNNQGQLGVPQGGLEITEPVKLPGSYQDVSVGTTHVLLVPAAE